MSEHGTRSRYVSGCRCDECTKANRDCSRKRYFAKIKDELGEANRNWQQLESAQTLITGLIVRGYGISEIARVTGIDKTTICAICNDKSCKHPGGRPYAGGGRPRSCCAGTSENSTTSAATRPRRCATRPPGPSWTSWNVCTASTKRQRSRRPGKSRRRNARPQDSWSIHTSEGEAMMNETLKRCPVCGGDGTYDRMKEPRAN